ncbi:TetR/AcrR family transcriptional regulator [Streptomyces avicenniae]|uniref:TetR/AcrR family transcriptional regulator n=1 Tax=Streptomyces avicenniae TaxID=500153 RepID=UPI000699E6F5|nr:TetR/AcrR family transcriptional regulator [Streptomyces avicenniae]
MSTAARRARERAQRHQLIITAARELAETEGWEAVTTRRLAERVEYSQPVLYSHFGGKDGIVRAVALEGFTELTAALRRARESVQEHGPEDGTGRTLRAVGMAYWDFAARHPALYQAMFVLPTDLKFAHEETPQALRDAFGEFVAAFDPADPERLAMAEVSWASLHGLTTLGMSGRVPTATQTERIELLVTLLVGGG